MTSTFLFLVATLLLSLNFVRPFGLAVSDWLYFGALGFALIETFSIDRHNAPCWWRNRFLLAVAFILFGAIISTMNSRNWIVAFVEIFQQFFVVTFFISLIWIMVRRGKTTQIILAFILSGVFTALVVFLDYSYGSKYELLLSGTSNVEWWGRYSGTLGHPNKLGYYLVLTVLLSLGQSLSIKINRKTFLIRLGWNVLIAVQVFALYLSGSLTSYLGLLLGTTVLSLSSKSMLFRVGKSFGMVAGFGLFLTIFMLIFNIIIMKGIVGLADNPVIHAFTRVRTITAGTRTVIYDQALEQIIRNPWFGVGYDQIATSGLRLTPIEPMIDVHNALLQIWYTGGIFAFIGWLMLYISAGWMALSFLIQAYRDKVSIVTVSISTALMAILLMDQFQDSIYQREKWLVIGLAAGLYWGKLGIINQLSSSQSGK
jgi:O-antigen ligase